MNKQTSTEKFDPAVLQQLGRIDLIAKLIVDGIRHGAHRSRRRGFSTEFSDFKAYAEGDDLRLLDWRLFARTDRLFIKRFQAETSLEVMLLLDATGSMAWRWQQRLSKLEYAANLLAALACLHMRQQDQVGLLMYDAHTLRHLPARCRRTQLESIFALLENVRPGKADSLPVLVDSLLGVRRHRGMIVICTDLEEDEKALSRCLDMLGGVEDEIILFHLLDEAEIELPFTEATHIRDSETQAVIPINLRNVVKEHQDSLERWRAGWQERCERNSVVYVPIRTSMDYVDVIWSMIAAREHRTAR